MTDRSGVITLPPANAVNYMEFQDWLFDKRVLRRNIRKGMVAREDFEGYLENLTDSSDNIAPPEEEEEPDTGTPSEEGGEKPRIPATEDPDSSDEDES